MAFLDQTDIQVEAGKGGDGAVSFLREKYRPMGGPNGGDGGNGGKIIFVANRDVVTLSDLDRRRYFKAPDGENGMKDRKKGKNGEDLKLSVPVGTIIRENSITIADLTTDGQEIRIVEGGQGGWGNWHFKTSIKQAPDWSKVGLEGEKKELHLELKLIADIGLIGLPNAGKSTLLSSISNAKPKIADYAFTTLTPNLGVVKYKRNDFIVADIPGLIEGAHEGKGLGIQFLRHIERTRLLIHVIPANSEDLAKDYQVIRKELDSFSQKLTEKPEIIAINKTDLVESADLEKSIKKLKRKAKGKIIIAISAATQKNISELLDKIIEFLSI